MLTVRLQHMVSRDCLALVTFFFFFFFFFGGEEYEAARCLVPYGNQRDAG